MTLLRTIKSTALATGLLTAAFVGSAAATPNTSSYSMQLSGNTINVYETNSEAVNAVEADFTYSGSTSSFAVTPAAGSTFTTCLSQTSSSVACTILGGSTAAGQHLVASLTFTPNAGVTSASVTVSMAGSSQVLAAADSTDTLNHATLPSATYSYTAPAPTSTGGTQPKTTTGTGSNSTGSGSTSGSTQTTTTTTNTPTTQTSSTSQTNKHYTPPQPRHYFFHGRHTGAVTSTVSALIILGAAAYWLVFRKRTEVAPAKVYKLDTTAESKTAGKKATRSQSTATTAKKAQPKKSTAKKAPAKTIKKTTKATPKKKA